MAESSPQLIENTVGKGVIAHEQFLLIPQCFNPLSNGKILDMTKLKAFADDKLNVAKMTISLYDTVENTMGKGENAGYQHFLLFPK